LGNSSISSKHISNDDLSSDRVNRKIRPPHNGSIMKKASDSQNGAVFIPQNSPGSETDSNNSQEAAFGKD
jgi:hypothetical protein